MGGVWIGGQRTTGLGRSGQLGTRIVPVPRTKAELVALIDSLNSDLAKMNACESKINQGYSTTASMGSSLAKSAQKVIGLVNSNASRSTLVEATEQMQEAQMSFNLQYLQLQSQMQKENRSYTAISNIMKTKHDTAKNSISNIR